MRITFGSIDDFCEDLREQAPDVFGQTVRVRVDRTPEQDEGITFTVGVWATALVRTAEGDWVLEFGEMAGRDTRANGNAGSANAAGWIGKIKAVTDAAGLKIRRGKIEVI